ncbi:translation initiation factor Sui1 [Aquabacterium sp. A7-Y]|uniref:translation initiation factor Sui1 n=1 Tax=Aquabacterium sp. A7-Y TaxID=1349605 RepID=UPI00223DDFAD|nr:translation initiation factor Sui1 [Aquabacterium sp. A7-Y]MCW7540219.1 translation initiation factor Sui1 [Aquabacterium sp. A7-Y]
MNNSSKTARLVYSTEGGRMCPECRRPQVQCVCARRPEPPAGDGKVRVWRESKGRGGKAVTVIKGVPLAGEALAELGKQLRTACGSGGTVKDGVIEIQGDHCDRVIERLQGRGWSVKRAGG